MKLKSMVKRDIIIAVVTIILLIIGITYTSYSLFFQVEETKEEVVQFGDLKVNYSTGSNTITRTADYPRTDIEGDETAPYTFTIKNTGTLKAKYTVLINDDTDYITSNSLVKVDDAYMKYKLNSNTPALLNTIVNNTLTTGSLEPNASITYTLKFWLKSDAPNEAIGKAMVKKLQVKAEYIPEQ